MTKKKLNVIDWLIIIGAFVLLVSVVAKFIVKDAVYSHFGEVRYISVEVYGVERTGTVMFAEGDNATCYNGEVLGTVVNEPAIGAHMEAIYNSENNSYTSVEDPGKRDILLVYEVKGYDSDSSFMLGGIYPIVPGMTLEISSGGYTGEAVILGISDKNS